MQHMYVTWYKLQIGPSLVEILYLKYNFETENLIQITLTTV